MKNSKKRNLLIIIVSIIFTSIPISFLSEILEVLSLLLIPASAYMSYVLIKKTIPKHKIMIGYFLITVFSYAINEFHYNIILNDDDREQIAKEKRDKIVLDSIADRKQFELDSVAREEKHIKDSIFNTEIVKKINQNWFKGYYNDEFGDATGKPYYTTTSKGVFSNSATTNSCVNMQILIDENVSVILYEYCNSNESHVSSYDRNAIIKFKIGDKSYKGSGYYTNNGKRIKLDKNLAWRLKDSMKKEKEIKIYIGAGHSNSSTYNAVFKSGNYNDIVNK